MKKFNTSNGLLQINLNKSMNASVSSLEISSSEERLQYEAQITKRRRSSSTRSSVSLGKSKGKKIKGFKRPPTVEFPSILGISKFSELRDLSLFALRASNDAPSIVKVNDRNSVKSVLLVLFSGIDSGKFYDSIVTPHSPRLLDDVSEELPFLNEQFTHFIPMNAPGDRESVYPLMKVFTKRPYTKQQRNNITKELSDKTVVLQDLKLKHYDMVCNGYPVHPQVPDSNGEATEGWVDTVKFDHDGSHTFAMDCEMCESASGKVLTRVSLIDFEENVLLDEYVKPEEEITNYLTQYSGITEELLEGVNTTLRDVQEKLLSLISSDDFLIGHSLENDLQVLKMRHPNIVDSALVYEHPRGPPFKTSLKYLASQHLDLSIQDGEHDSVEDAKACLKLIKHKLVKGALLGKVIDGVSIFDDLEAVDKKALILEFNRVQPHQDRYVQCFNDQDVVDKLSAKSNDCDLIVAHLKDIECAQNEGNFEENRQLLLTKLNKRLQSIYDAAPTNSLVIFSSCYGDQRRLKELRGHKRLARQESLTTSYNSENTWTSENEQLLRQTAADTRKGAVFIKVKEPATDAIEE